MKQIRSSRSLPSSHEDTLVVLESLVRACSPRFGQLPGEKKVSGASCPDKAVLERARDHATRLRRAMPPKRVTVSSKRMFALAVRLEDGSDVSAINPRRLRRSTVHTAG